MDLAPDVQHVGERRRAPHVPDHRPDLEVPELGVVQPGDAELVQHRRVVTAVVDGQVLHPAHVPGARPSTSPARRAPDTPGHPGQGE